MAGEPALANMIGARPRAVLDHLVVGAATLAQGVAFIRERCGVDMPSGGKHPRMGTHNRLLRIGEHVFLEVIAIDPEAPLPGEPRWFGLDDPMQQARLRERPSLIAWVAGVPDLAEMGGAVLPFGTPREMTRGDLRWQIAFPASGEVSAGVMPALIQWPPGPHPSLGMADVGLRFEALRLRHPEPDRIREELARVGADHLAECRYGDAPVIEADLRRADGTQVTLD